MTDTATVDQNQATTQTETTTTSDVSQVLATSLWTGVMPEAPATSNLEAQSQVPSSESAATTQPTDIGATTTPTEQAIDVDEYFKKEFGLDAAETKAQWENFQKQKDLPPAPPEIKFANEESKNFYQLLAEGKEDDLYSFLNQKKQIERLEKLSVENTNEAAEILRANLLFKNKNLSREDADFMVEETYLKPQKPNQSLEETDDDFSMRVKNWEEQVKRIDRKMIIDAKLAQNEIPSYKSQVVLPQIPKAAEVQQPNQKELDEALAKAIQNTQRAIQENYQNFKGFSVTAKDGDVQLPISYGISPEELMASKTQLETFDINSFFENRWFDENGNPKVLQIQEDLYMMQNRDRVLQSVANEAASQRYLHHLKSQNNINMNGVNTHLGPPAQQQQKSESQMMAEQIWSI